MTHVPQGPVTMLFSDIESSTSLWNDHPAAMGEAHTRHNEILESVFDTHQGQVLKDKGDGFIVVFTNPVKALEAAADAQRLLAAESWPEPVGPLRVRMGINTGIVEPRGGDYYGPQVNRTARLEGLAHGGQVLVSDSTRALVSGQLSDGLELRDVGEHALRGFSEAERVFQLSGGGLTNDFPPIRGIARGGRLPVFSNSFLGRESQIDQIVQLVSQGARLVTLLGPGGIGKTRLAVEAARELEPVMSGGTHFADLAPLPSPERVGVTVAESVGVHAEGNADVLSLVADTVTTPTLVVVDNFEHVIEARTSIGALLSNTPELSVIATSRQPLALRDENVFRLEPLDVASNGKPSPAVELFYERAAAQGVRLSSEERETVESICAKLDGLPLAIELVAPRTRLVSVDEIEKMLAKSLDALGSGPADLPERHRTIRQAIDWSLEGLSASERTLFMRLSCLPAGGTLEMIEHVCGEGLEGPVFDQLATLVDTSLVNSVTGVPGGTRFKQLSLLREYGLELLQQDDEYGTTMDRLVDYYVDSSATNHDRLYTDNATDSEVTADLANLLAAMEWSLEADRAAEMARVTMDMWVYWFRGDRIQEPMSWVKRARQTIDTPEIHWLTGFFAFQTGDFAEVAASMTAAISGFSELGDVESEAMALIFGALAQDDPETSHRMIDDALARLVDPGARVISLLFKSIVDFMTGDLESSMQTREELLSLMADLEMPELTAWLHWNLALSYYGTGRFQEAADSFARAFGHMAEERYQEGVASVAVGVGLCEIQAGRIERGVNLLGAADKTFEKLGTVQWFEAAAHTEASAARLVEEIGQESYDHYYQEGRELSFTEMIDVAGAALAELSE